MSEIMYYEKENKDNDKTEIDYKAELQKMRKLLDYQNTILSAISYISSTLLYTNNNTLKGDLLHAMEIMGEAAEVDRVYIWENHKQGDELYASQVYEWSCGVEPQQDKELVKNVSYKDDMPDWEKVLSRGHCINGLINDLPEREKEILSAQGVRSILVVPIFLYQQFWGFVGFDDCHNERIFSANEEKILRSASELIANAFIRNHMEQSIQRLEIEVDKIYIDPLTGIFNRRYFNENIDRLIRTLSRSGSSLSLMMVDIDYFKKYNDSYGHLKGDECLKLVAETLSNSTMREDDFVARYGGEEFVVVLPNTDEKSALLIAERMIANIRKQNIPHEKNDSEKRVTVSIGITSGAAKHTLGAEDFVQCADELLYEVKRNGRNNYQFGMLETDMRNNRVINL